MFEEGKIARLLPNLSMKFRIDLQPFLIIKRSLNFLKRYNLILLTNKKVKYLTINITLLVKMIISIGTF